MQFSRFYLDFRPAVSLALLDKVLNKFDLLGSFAINTNVLFIFQFISGQNRTFTWWFLSLKHEVRCQERTRH